MIAMSILIFALGLAIGSFLNVCIYRLPQGLSIHSPRRSFCPECRTPIRFYDNIPVLSYLFLRGRCRHCDTKISRAYPLVELMTGFLFLFSLYRFGPTLTLLHSCLFISLLIPIAWIDARWYIIPNAIILVGLITGTALTLLIALTIHNPGYLIEHLIGAVAGGASMALITVVGTFLFRKKSDGWRRHQIDDPNWVVPGRLAPSVGCNHGFRFHRFNHRIVPYRAREKKWRWESNTLRSFSRNWRNPGSVFGGMKSGTGI